MKPDQRGTSLPATLSGVIRANLPAVLAVFLLTFFLLFLGMTRRPNIYDEGIVLTGAMRVAAGQVPHRDFYANYGPGQFYVFAWLFRLFGQSVFVERIFDLFCKAFILTSVYVLLLRYTSRQVAAATSFVGLLWLFGLNACTASAVVSVLLLSLVAAMLLLSVFVRPPSTRRMLAAGAVAGLAALFRYDVGLALLGIEFIALAIAAWLNRKDRPAPWRGFIIAFLLCVGGFVIVFAPPAVFYLLHAPLSAFLHDILLYPGKYYHRSRSLPFPRVTLRTFDELVDYLPIPLVLTAIYALVASRGNSSNPIHRDRSLQGFIIVFALLAAIMYFKGLIRLTPVQLYLCIFPALLILAVLFERRAHFAKPLRLVIVSLVALWSLAALVSARTEARELRVLHSSVPVYLLHDARHSLPPEEAAWCSHPSTLTTGFCFQPDLDRIRTIDYISAHTTPAQPLFVGLDRHDKIFANDNLIYFATQRLPATHWSHFDPNMQNTLDVQTQMIQEFEHKPPPLMVLDSEFEAMHEPNDSSRSTGVLLLDNYIQSNYRKIETYGPFVIWQRNP